jgi:hypothetical protein
MICTSVIDVLDSSAELPISAHCTMVPFRPAVTLMTDNTDVNGSIVLIMDMLNTIMLLITRGATP